MNSTLHSGKLRNMASIYLRNGDHILLLFRQGNSIVKNLWIGSAGGHFEESEVNDAKGCVLRELWEELSIADASVHDLTLRYVTLRYTDGEIRQNYYFFADVDFLEAPTSSEGITRWFKLDDLKDLPMPFTARYMLHHYQLHGQFDDTLYAGIANDDGMIFLKL